MRGKDLFEQRGPGTREAHDEDGIRFARADAFAPGEQLACAGVHLHAGIALNDFRPIAYLGMFELIAALVVAVGFLIVAAILEGKTQGEAKMVAIGRRYPRPRLLMEHARELIVGEAVGLEIGEAPIGIAVIRTGRARRVIGNDGLLAPARSEEHTSELQSPDHLV